MPLVHNGHVKPTGDSTNAAGPTEHLFRKAEIPQGLALNTSELKKTTGADQPSSEDDSMTRSETLECVCGLLYLVFTLTLSMYYLQILSPSMANDLWWDGFNASGVQSYLIDVYNSQLNLVGNQSASLDFTDKNYALEKDYTKFYTPIKFTPVYPRIVLDSMVYDLALAVNIIRQMVGPESVITQYCWVDLDRKWEVAHTALRQDRCKARYTDNGAVYYEPVIRLVNWKKWMNGNFGGNFNTTIGNSLRSTRRGQDWLDVTPLAFVNVETEVAYWQQKGIVKYAMQYINNFEWGMEETLAIQNAFGVTQDITIKRTAYNTRIASWTTIWMYFGPWNDLVFAGWYGYSFLLDNPNNQRFMAPCDYSDYLANPTNYSCKPCGAASLQDDSDCYADYEMFLNLPDSPGFELVHSNIGELNSIDLYFVRVPPSLSALYSTFQGLVSQLVLSSDEFATAMSKIPNLPSDPVPPAWILPDFMYMGGDPTCLSRQPTSFVQTSFAFDVSCSTEEAQSILLTPSNTLFALWATSQTSVSSICKVCSTRGDSCSTVFASALKAVNILNQKYPSTSSSYHSLIQAAYNDIGTLGVSTIQLAVNTSDDSNQFLRQQILGGHSATQWDVFGWIYTYEWAQGFREVVSFEGDANILPLVSDKYSPVINEAQPLEVPTSSCQYLWSASVVVSSILFFVGLIVIFYSFLLHGRIVGRNLFQFNRVVGAMWLGRPILLVRSLTAIILLCTSPLKFQRHNGNAVFEFKPRSFVESLVVAGESTWISYVINDVLLVLTANNQPHYAPVSTWIGWLIMAVFDIASPYRVKANMNRQCSIDYLNKKLTCTSAEIYVGSVERAITLALIQIGSVSIAFLLNSIWMWLKRSTSKSSNSHLLLSGTAIAFLHKDTLPNGAWMFDRVSCVLCGLITFRKSIFDVKLWILVPDKPFTKPHIKWKKKVFDPPFLAHPLHHDPTVRHVVENSTQVVPVGHPLKLMHRVMMLAGLLYVGATIFGSVIYLNLTADNMANDLWWANYNATREHVYVSRLYNWHLNIRPHGGDVSITDAKFMDDANYTTSLAKGVSATMKPYYISRILSTDAMDLSTVIHSLRVMDACLAPWISVQYCWLDFHMNWEMANSAARQIRCANNYSTNAAVYLESVLRNVQWTPLRSCWGTSLETALGTPLSRLPNGASWWNSVQTVSTSEADELHYWQSFGIKQYTTDWQNYKSIGIIDSFGIQNAFGLTYSMTLKYTNGTFNLDGQSSMKMYWSFASDLWAVTSPSTLMYKTSLIRQDSLFAFKNDTMESVLIQNGSMTNSDLTRGGAYSVFRQTFGPFGSVDLKRIPAPESLMALSLYFSDTLAQLRVQSANVSQAFQSIPTLPQIGYIPPPWLIGASKYSAGGNLLCPDIPLSPLKQGTLLLTGAVSACGSILGEYMPLVTSSRLIATVGANLVRQDLNTSVTNAVCATITMINNASCTNKLLWPSVRFFQNESLITDQSILPTLRSMTQAAQIDIRALGIEINQYGATLNRTLTLLRHKIFDPAYPSFHYVAWLIAMDWAANNREVISFQGDLGWANVISTPYNDITSLVNPLEIPVNVSYYIRYVCLYVTAIIMCVATFASIYLLLHRGYVEGLNLFEINRVAGIVWIGRTFLFIRSMAAICLLSTQVLSLESINNVWHLVDATQLVDENTIDRAVRIFKTFLAAGEVCWLGYVLNDILMVFTAQYTTAYVVKCTTIVWGVAAILSLQVPPSHVATIQRECTFAHLDFQMVCSSGTVSIGRFSRFMLLVGLCVGTIIVCYLYERLRRRALPPMSQHSFFLSISAKHMFQPKHWMDHDVYRMDCASAAINGILSFRVSKSLYIIDFKIWRLFVMDILPEERQRLIKEGKRHLLSAVPLTD